MKNWIFPQFLCVLFFVIHSNAQETLSTSPLLKSSTGGPESSNSILSKAKSSLHHTILASAINASDLVGLLALDGQFTVFAPSNQAFNKLSNMAIQRLLDPTNKKELNKLLSGHIIAGKLSAAYMLRSMCSGSGKASFTTIQGDELTATIDGIDIILTDKYGNQAKIMAADSNQSNGVIHEIDTVFLPLGPL